MAGPELVPCKHCNETGTCNPGAESCGLCIKRWKTREGEVNPTRGLVCSVCWGKGLVEASAAKWSNRFPFFLASVLVIFGFSLLFGANWAHIDGHQALTFVGTLLGSVTGYYFGGERSRTVSASGNKKPSTPNDQGLADT